MDQGWQSFYDRLLAEKGGVDNGGLVPVGYAQNAQNAGYGYAPSYGDAGVISLADVPLYDFSKRMFKAQLRHCIEKGLHCIAANEEAINHIHQAIEGLTVYQNALAKKYSETDSPQKRAIIKAKYNLLELHKRMKWIKKMKKREHSKLDAAFLQKLSDFYFSIPTTEA